MKLGLLVFGGIFAGVGTGLLVAAASEPDTNTMPAMISAVKTMATEGEIVAALESVFGTYVEKAVL